MVDGGSYISIGDMYKGNKIILPGRWKGKGLSVSVLACGCAKRHCHHTLVAPIGENRTSGTCFVFTEGVSISPHVSS